MLLYRRRIEERSLDSSRGYKTRLLYHPPWRKRLAQHSQKRCGKSCRLRWANYLKPGIKRGAFTKEEDQIIIMLHASLGNKWSSIAQHLPDRTDNEIKNYWNTHLKKRLIDKSIDPVSHKQLAYNPSPAAEPGKSDSQEESNPDEHSSQWSSSTSSVSISLPLSSSFNTTTTTIPETSSGETGFLSCKKRFERSSSTSRLLNKIAARGASIGKILSNLLNDRDAKEDLGSITGYDGDIAENNGGYNQELFMYDVSSTLVDEDNDMVGDITGWSNLLDLQDFIYVQDSYDMVREMITEPKLCG